jgi:hypothetical protein
MEASAMGGILCGGEQGRAAGIAYFEYPFLRDTNIPVRTPEQLLAWCDLGNAWVAGWLKADAGRNEAMAKLMRVKYWWLGTAAKCSLSHRLTT